MHQHVAAFSLPHEVIPRRRVRKLNEPIHEFFIYKKLPQNGPQCWCHNAIEKDKEPSQNRVVLVPSRDKERKRNWREKTKVNYGEKDTIISERFAISLFLSEK
jgi:hypothetical protein